MTFIYINKYILIVIVSIGYDKVFKNDFVNKKILIPVSYANNNSCAYQNAEIKLNAGLIQQNKAADAYFYRSNVSVIFYIKANWIL